MPRFAFLTLTLLIGSAVIHAEERPAGSAPDDLQRYVARPEPAFRWELVESQQTDVGGLELYQFTSQTWQNIEWTHALAVYSPAEVVHPKQVLLFVTGGRTGGRPGADDRALGLLLAQRCRARVAVLHAVPNQPLFGDHVEDDLITETWLKYLETGDATWPLLFPMVKSAVKAMDAIQEISRQKWTQPVETFVITGASKRGWTSWLTPVADPRVIATAPMVIDMLNFNVQSQQQMKVWGKFSEQIEDYTRKGLVREDGQPRTEREAHLWKMMDPYTYRAQLTLPKLIINGANDRYWLVDATSNYWDDLHGPKRIHVVPNAGHNLKEGRDAVLSTIGVYFQHLATGTELPQLAWRQSVGDESLHLSLTSDREPVAVKVWTAASATTDFRESPWTAKPASGKEGEFAFSIPRQPDGHQAFFGQAQYQDFGLDYFLTTLVYTTVDAAPATATGQ